VHSFDRISQTELNQDTTITESIFEAIKSMRKMAVISLED
jgi:hypothetical protein